MYKKLVTAAGVITLLLAVTGSAEVRREAAAGSLTASSKSQYRTQDKAQEKPQDKQAKTPQPSEGESKAAAKVEAAPDPTAKIQAAGEFVKKYPKSTLRPKVAGYLASEINAVSDAAQRITLLENLLTVLKEPTDADVINPLLVDAYMKSQPPRLEDALRVAGNVVARKPEDLTSLTQITVVGAEQAKKGDLKYATQAQQAGQKAILIIESGKKPENFDDARWSEYQTKWQPVLHQALGVIDILSGNRAEARTHLDKAAALNSSDPFTFVLLGTLANDEYQKVAEQHKTQSAGPMKDELLKQAHGKMDQVIDFYARAVAVAAGKPDYQKLHDQVLADLQTYWKYRHAGSLDGLQQVIDKYKRP
jgi:hypothetical protein